MVCTDACCDKYDAKDRGIWSGHYISRIIPASMSWKLVHAQALARTMLRAHVLRDGKHASIRQDSRSQSQLIPGEFAQKDSL